MKNLKAGQVLYIKKEFPGFEDFTPIGKKCEYISQNNNMHTVKVGYHKVGVSMDELETYFSLENPEKEVEIAATETKEDNVIKLERFENQEDKENLTIEEIAKENDITVEQAETIIERANDPQGEELTLDQLEEIAKEVYEKRLNNLIRRDNKNFSFDAACGLLPKKIITKEEDKITIVILSCGTKGIAKLHKDDEWDEIKGIEVAWIKAKKKYFEKNMRKVKKQIKKCDNILEEYLK